MKLILTNNATMACSLRDALCGNKNVLVRSIGDGKTVSAIDAVLEITRREFDSVCYVGSYGSTSIDVGTIVIPNKVTTYETYVSGIENKTIDIGSSCYIDDVEAITMEKYIDSTIAKEIVGEKENVVFDGETSSVVQACNACQVECDVIGVVTYDICSDDVRMKENDFLRGNEYAHGIIKFIIG